MLYRQNEWIFEDAKVTTPGSHNSSLSELYYLGHTMLNDKRIGLKYMNFMWLNVT